MYTNFVIQNYGEAIVVFDGYNNTSPAIKDMTHMRRRKGIQSAFVNFNPEMKFTGQKETFLSNDQNKQRIICLIGEMLIKCGCTVNHASGDAGIDIVKHAILSSKNYTTTVVGEDTDLLILFFIPCKEL